MNYRTAFRQTLLMSNSIIMEKKIIEADIVARELPTDEENKLIQINTSLYSKQFAANYFLFTSLRKLMKFHKQNDLGIVPALWLRKIRN